MEQRFKSVIYYLQKPTKQEDFKIILYFDWYPQVGEISWYILKA